MKLIHDNILVKPIKEKTTTKAGIILPKSTRKENLGEVVLIGDKVKFIKVGDIVKYYEHTGVGINYNGKHHLLLSEKDDIISIL